MKAFILKVLRITAAVLACALTYMPISSFPGLKQYYLTQGVYQEACRVSSGIGDNQGVLCLDRIQKFDVILVVGSLSSSFAILLAYLALDYIGFIFSNFLGAVLVAGGYYILSTPEKEMLFKDLDSYLWGVVLISLGSPFIAAGALDSAHFFKNHPRIVLASLLTLMQLFAAGWSWWIDYRQPETVKLFFGELLWLPLLIVALSFLIAPFTSQSPPGNVARLLRKGLHKRHPREPQPSALTPLLSHQRARQDIARKVKDPLKFCPKFLWKRASGQNAEVSVQIRSEWFVLFALFYTLHIFGQNLFFSSGIEDAWYTDQVDISNIVLYWRPALAALVVPPVFWAISGGIATTYNFAIAAVVNIAAETLFILGFWRYGAILMGPARVCLTAVSVDYVSTIFGSASFGLIYSFVILASGIGDLFLPSVNRAFWLNYSNMFQCFTILLASQLLLSIVMIRKLWYQTRLVRTKLLKVEADRALSRAMPHLFDQYSIRSSEESFAGWSAV